ATVALRSGARAVATPTTSGANPATRRASTSRRTRASTVTSLRTSTTASRAGRGPLTRASSRGGHAVPQPLHRLGDAVAHVDAGLPAEHPPGLLDARPAPDH